MTCPRSHSYGECQAQIKNSWLKSSTSLFWSSHELTNSAERKAVLWMQILTHLAISKHLPWKMRPVDIDDSKIHYHSCKNNSVSLSLLAISNTFLETLEKNIY